MDNDTRVAFEGLIERLDSIKESIKNIYDKVDRIDTEMSKHSIEIGEIKKDVEHIKEGRKELKEEIGENQKTMWKRMDEKVDQKSVDEIVENSENKIKVFIWKLFATISAGVLLNFLRDLLWPK